MQNVALTLENGPEWQEICLAPAGAGVAVVPLDPKMREPEVTHILKDSEEVEQIVERCPFVKDILALGYRVGGESGERVGAIAVPNDEAITAWNKSVPLSRAATEALLRDEVLGSCRTQIPAYKLPRKIVIRHEPLERTLPITSPVGTPPRGVREAMTGGRCGEPSLPELPPRSFAAQPRGGLVYEGAARGLCGHAGRARGRERDLAGPRGYR